MNLITSKDKFKKLMAAYVETFLIQHQILTKKEIFFKKRDNQNHTVPLFNHFLKGFYDTIILYIIFIGGRFSKVEHDFCLDWGLNDTILKNKTLIIIKNNYL